MHTPYIHINAVCGISTLYTRSAYAGYTPCVYAVYVHRIFQTISTRVDTIIVCSEEAEQSEAEHSVVYMDSDIETDVEHDFKSMSSPVKRFQTILNC